MEPWMISLIIGIVAIVGLGLLTYFIKKPAGKVIFGLMTTAAVILTVVVVGPSIEIGEAPPPPTVVGAADWRMVSATEPHTYVVPWGDDDHKILMNFNDTSNAFNSGTQWVEVDYRFQNFGAADGSGVVCTITDYGQYYYDVTDDYYWIISKYDKKFNSNWTIDGSTAVNQIASVTVPSNTETKTGLVKLNLTGSASCVQYMTQSTDSVITEVVFTNSITNNIIATIQYNWEKTSITTRSG